MKKGEQTVLSNLVMLIIVIIVIVFLIILIRYIDPLKEVLLRLVSIV